MDVYTYLYLLMQPITLPLKDKINHVCRAARSKPLVLAPDTPPQSTQHASRQPLYSALYGTLAQCNNPSQASCKLLSNLLTTTVLPKWFPCLKLA